MKYLKIQGQSLTPKYCMFVCLLSYYWAIGATFLKKVLPMIMRLSNYTTKILPLVLQIIVAKLYFQNRVYS